MKFFRYSLLLFFFLVHQNLFAQVQLEIRMHIKDSISNRNISNPLIKILNDVRSNGVSKNFIQVNPDSSYTIMKDPRRPLKYNILAFGYSAKTISLNPQTDTAISVFLSPLHYELKEVNVASSQPKLKLIQGGMSIRPDVASFDPATFLSTYLKYIPGLTLSSQGALSFLGRNVTLYVDGRQINISGPDLIAYLQQMGVKDVKNINILTEPGAGFGASNGTILDIKTNRFSSIGVQHIIGAGITTHDKYYLNNSLTAATQNLRLAGNVLLNHNNFYDRNSYSISSPRSPELNATQTLNYPETPQNSISTRFGLDGRAFKRLTYGASFFGSFASKNYDYSYDIQRANSLEDYNSSNDINTRRYQESAYIEYELKKGVFKIDFSNTNYHNKNTVVNARTKGSEPIETSILNRSNSVTKNYFVNVSQNWEFAENFSLNGGIRFANNRLKNNFESDAIDNVSTTYREKIYAGFIESTFAIKKFGFQAGLRVEKTDFSFLKDAENKSRMYTNWFPNFGVMFPNIHSINMMAFFSSSIERPSYVDYFPYPDNINYNSILYATGNSSIMPTRIYTYGLKMQKQFKNETSLILNISRSEARDPEFYIPIKNGNVIGNIPVNLSNGNKYTISAILSKEWKSISMTLTPKYERVYLDTYNGSFDSQPVIFKLDGANLYSINYQFNFKLFKNLNNTLTGSYGSKKYDPLGYQEPSGFMAYRANKNFLKGLLNVSVELSDPFNWSRNNSYQFINDIVISNFNKPETRMLYISASFRIGKLRPSKAGRHDYESDDRIEQDRL